MAVYAQLQASNYLVGPGIDATAWNGTRGKTIMDQLAASHAPMPMLADRIANAMDLFNTAMQGAWTWKPTGASAAGGALLDGSSLTGECAQLVSAFKTLLRAPAPYGFGLADGDVASEEWPGGGAVQLFVVKHTGTVFGLYPNVLKTNWKNLGGAARFENLYGWGNHKVLRVNCNGQNFYFDPCYNNVYLTPSEMADATLITTETVTMNKQPVVTKYNGRSRFGRAVSFGAVGSATPEILKGNIKTVDNYWPVLIGELS